MAKEIDPRVAHILQPGRGIPTPDAPPWDKKNCYRLYFPLHPERVYFFANGQDDKESLWGPNSAGATVILKAVSMRKSDEGLVTYHRDMMLFGVGFVIETVPKPVWFDEAYKKFTF